MLTRSTTQCGKSLMSRAYCALLALIFGVCATSASAQLRVATYNTASLNGDQSAMQDVFEAMITDDKPGFAVAPHVIVFQEVKSDEVAVLLSLLNAAGAPHGISYTQGTYNSNNQDSWGGAQAMYYRADVVQELTSGYEDHYTGAGRYSDRWWIRLIGYNATESTFYIFSSHLKASTGGVNEQERLDGVETIRQDADGLPQGTHIIYAGDMNFYDNGEPGYLHFLSAGAGQAVDPFGSGSWGGSSNAIKHTQSPRIAGGSLIGGGLDDRFDFMLMTSEFIDGQGLALLTGTYRSFGNDGNHYDDAINDGNNTYYPGDITRSNALADDLHDASDHIPVIADFQIPAMMLASADTAMGRIVLNSSAQLAVDVENGADVVIAAGADDLVFTATASGDLSGTDGATVPALAGPYTANFPVDTSAAGPVSGSVLLETSNQGAANPTITLNATGDVVRGANASFSDVADEDNLLFEREFAPNSGVYNLAIDVHNFGFDADQALLDLDAVDPVTSPYTYVGGLQAGVGAAPAELTYAFDTTGLSDGLYQETVQISVSDEDILGETTGVIVLTMRVTVGDYTPVPGDVNGDGVVDLDDLCAWYVNPVDVDGDEDVDNEDEQWLLDELGITFEDINGNGVHDGCEEIVFVFINEVRVDESGVDTEEYFELFGTPGTTLEGMTYLVIGDGETDSDDGTIEEVIDLTGYTLDAGGFFVVAEATFTQGTADLVADLNFEDGDNVTHMLVTGFTGAMGSDLDSNNDGVLDSTPWSEVVDVIAIIKQENPPASTEFHYGPPTIGPVATLSPYHVYRCDPDRTWMIGEFTVGLTDTPGWANTPCEPVTCPWDAAPEGGDGTVGLGDLNGLLSNWGACPAPCVWDLAPEGGDDSVGLGDLNALLSNWGPCP
jgi:endonuclease/exonuclease/phosphatase family metal-dependent hydrolase